MPKKVLKLRVKLDLLHPQSEPQKILIKFFRWLLSSGRFLIIVVEIIVLTAFLVRFKFDADLSSTKDAIEQQLPFIESLAADENLIRQTQFQLATIKDIRQNSPDFSEILKKVAAKTPTGVKVKNMSLQNTVGKTNLKISATATDNNQLASFIAGLKSDNSFEEITLADVSLDQGIINFAINTNVRMTSANERKL